MAKIQFTNLQQEHQLTAAELTQVIGGMAGLTGIIMFHKKLAVFYNPDTLYGAVNSALKEAANIAELAGDMDRVNQLMDIHSARWLHHGGSVTQVIYPG